MSMRSLDSVWMSGSREWFEAKRSRRILIFRRARSSWVSVVSTAGFILIVGGLSVEEAAVEARDIRRVYFRRIRRIVWRAFRYWGDLFAWRITYSRSLLDVPH